MEIGPHRGVMANWHISVRSNWYEKVNNFKYLGFLLRKHNSNHEEIKYGLKAGNSCCYSVQMGRIGSNSYEKGKSFKYLGYLLRKQNFIDEEIKHGL